MIPFIAAKGSEIVFAPQEETKDGSLSLKNLERLLELGNEADMIVLGPGLSLVEETQVLARTLAADLDRPILLDGDGITALSSELDILRNRDAQTVLTPHPGEMSRITGLSVKDIYEDPVSVLQNTTSELGAVIVLKGAHSLIGFPDETVYINMSGNSGMASAGSGDVLTGTIAAMTGLGLDLGEAVRKGVFIHGLAGDLAAEDLGPDGITAQDILEALPLAVKLDREGLDEDLRERYAGAEVV